MCFLLTPNALLLHKQHRAISLLNDNKADSCKDCDDTYVVKHNPPNWWVRRKCFHCDCDAFQGHFKAPSSCPHPSQRDHGHHYRQNHHWWQHCRTVKSSSSSSLWEMTQSWADTFIPVYQISQLYRNITLCSITQCNVYHTFERIVHIIIWYDNFWHHHHIQHTSTRCNYAPCNTYVHTGLYPSASVNNAWKSLHR